MLSSRSSESSYNVLNCLSRCFVFVESLLPFHTGSQESGSMEVCGTCTREMCLYIDVKLK